MTDKSKDEGSNVDLSILRRERHKSDLSTIWQEKTSGDVFHII